MIETKLFMGEKSLMHFLIQVPDPRVKNRCRHNLSEILIMMVCGILCSVETWEDLELFANEHINWFKKYLKLVNGIPSHDTFLRVAKVIHPKTFEKIFFEWMQSVREIKKGQVIAMDGKAVCGTCREIRTGDGQALALVNVWATEDGICLGQMRANTTGSSELKTIKEILNYLNIEGMIVTVDAASATSSFTEEIRKRKADYVIPVKRSMKSCAQDLLSVFNDEKIKKEKTSKNSSEKGRKEKRSCILLKDEDLIESLGIKSNFKDVQTIAMVTYEREEKYKALYGDEKIGDKTWRWKKRENGVKTSYEMKFYLSSLKLSGEELMGIVRKHWEIENKLNWVLDVNFREDANRTRDKAAAENMSLLRKLAMNLVRDEKTFNKSMRLKMRKCLYNEAYREKILFDS